MSGVKALLVILLGQTFVLPNEAALVVSAPTPHKAQLGEDIVLPCSFKVDGSSIDLQYLAILWLFQDREILRFDNKETTSHPTMSINTKEIPKGIASMEIKNVTISNIGRYRCMVIYSPQREYKDIDLNVYATPSVVIENIEKEDKTSFILCSVTGFYPRNITVKILKDNVVMEDSALSEYHTNANGTYSVNRTWRIPSEGSFKILSCLVHHETLTPYVQKDLQLFHQGQNNNRGIVLGCIVGGLLLILIILVILWIYKRKSDAQRFMVKEIESPVWIDGEKTTLSCKASNCTRDVQVTWVIKLRDGTQHEVSDTGSSDKEEEEPLMSREYKMTKEQDSQKMKEVTTKLTFIPSISRHLGSTVLCRFIHQNKPVEKTWEVKSIYAKPKFIEPIQFTLSDQGDVQIAVQLQKFYPLEMEVSWFSKRGQTEEKIDSENTKSNSGDTFNLESKCRVSGDVFIEPTNKVIVRWRHQSMEEAQSREVSVRDLPWHPKLQTIPIESVFQDDEVLLQCRLSEYFPDALSVKWFERMVGSQNLMEISSSQKYKIPEISSYKMENRTFSSTAVLSYKRSDLTEKGVEFICRVEHVSLDTPIQNSIVQFRDTEAPTFIVNNIQGPQTWYSGEKVTLYCTASYCLEGTQVIWMVKSGGGIICELGEDGTYVKTVPQSSLDYVTRRERTEVSDKEGLQDVTSSLTFIPSIIKHQNISIACKILCDGKVKEKTFQRKYLYAKPKTSGPIKLSLTDSGEVLCSLDIEGFYPSDISIKWNDKETSEPTRTSQNSDGTYRIDSDYKLPGSFFSHRDSTVRVSWKHESMGDWERRLLSVLDKEFPWKVNLQDIPVPILLIDRTAMLKCEVSNVFPDVLSVKWLKKEKGGEDVFPIIQSQTYNISELRPEKQKDKTFTYKPCLKFNPSISAEDGAEFICRVEHPTLERPAEKSTGPLTIKGFPKVKDIICDDEDLYSLEVDGFYPKGISVSWRLCSQSSTGNDLTSNATCQANEDGSYRVTSTCDLRKTNNNLEKWTEVEAKVEHETLDSPIVKRTGIKFEASTCHDGPQHFPPQTAQQVPIDGSVSAFPPTDLERFIVGEIQGPSRWIHREMVTLYCSVSHCSEDTHVMWMVVPTDGKEEEISNTRRDLLVDSGYMISKEIDKSDKEGLFNITATLILVPSVHKHHGVIIACRISSDGQTKTKKLKLNSILAKPQVLEHVKTSLCDGGDVLCSLKLQSMYPKHVTITWKSGEDQLKSKEEFEENNDGTFNGHSHCTVPGKLLLDPNFTLHVSWRHKSLTEPQSQILTWRDPGLPWCPVIEEVPISRILINQHNPLQYNISGYFPDDLTVSWYKKQKEEYIELSHSDKSKIPDIQSQRQSDHTYSCTAKLLFRPTVKDEGAEIICRVSHPSLERPIEKGSGPLQVQGKPNAKNPMKTSRCKGELIFSQRLENFYPGSIQTEWCYWSGEEQGQRCPSQERYNTNIDKTFSVISQCSVSEDLLHHPNFRVRLTWQHESMDEKEYRESPGRHKAPEQKNPVIQHESDMMNSQHPPGVPVSESHHPPIQHEPDMMNSQHSPGVPVPESHRPPIQDVSNMMNSQHPLEVPVPESHHAHVQDVSNMSSQNPPDVPVAVSHHPHVQDGSNMISHQHHPGVPTRASHHPHAQDVSNMSSQHHPGVPLSVSYHPPPPQHVPNIMAYQHHPDSSTPEFHHLFPQDECNMVGHSAVPALMKSGSQIHHEEEAMDQSNDGEKREELAQEDASEMMEH